MNVDRKEKPSTGMSHQGMAWVVCFCSSLYFFYEFVQLNIFNSLDVYLMQAFNLDALETGHLSSLYFYANLIFLIPAGVMIDRYSTRMLIIASMLIASTSTLVFGLSHILWITAVSRFMIGVGAAFCFLACIRIASRWFPPQKLALATGVIVTMAMIGGIVAQTPLAMLIKVIGWRPSLVVDAVMGYVITLVIWFTVQDYPPGKTAMHERSSKEPEMSMLQSLCYVSKNPQNWFCGLYTSLLNLPIFLLGAIWGIMYLNQVHLLSDTDASYATSMLFLGTIIGSPVFGYISDRLLKRKLPMIVGAVLSLMTIMVLMYFPELSMTSIVVLFFLLGFFTSAQILSFPLIAEHNPMSMTGTAISIASMCIMLGGIVTQPLFGWLMQRNWDHTYMNGAPVYAIDDINNGMFIMTLAFIGCLIFTGLIRESGYHTKKMTEDAHTR